MNYLQNGLWASQILFYIVTAIVVVLTYRNAKRGLLSSAHTEYHKHVITRLSEISERLDSKFDPYSENYWPKEQPMKPAVDVINQKFRTNKEEIPKAGEMAPGPYFLSEYYQQTKHLARSVEADPFTPTHIRRTILEWLDNRARVMDRTEIEALKEYEKAPVKGTDIPNFHPEQIEKNWNWVDAILTDMLENKGYGPRHSEAKVEEIRLMIQVYLESFAPMQPNSPRV